MRQERVAQVGDPLRAGRGLHRGADEMDEPGGDVVSTTSIPSLRAIEIAFGMAVAFQVTFSSGRAAGRRRWPQADGEVDAGAAVQLVGEPAPARTDVAGTVHPRLRRERQVSVLVQPLRVVRSEHVRLDPERREMARNFSDRWTPPPPAGGKYSVTSRSFTDSMLRSERLWVDGWLSSRQASWRLVRLR